MSSIETLKNRLERLNVEKMKVEQGTERTREDLEEIGEMADRVRARVYHSIMYVVGKHT